MRSAAGTCTAVARKRSAVNSSARVQPEKGFVQKRFLNHLAISFYELLKFRIKRGFE